MEDKEGTVRPSTLTDWQRKLDQVLLPAWGGREVSEITRWEVSELVRGIKAQGTPIHANRVLALVKIIFNHGLQVGFPSLEANPAGMLKPPGQEKPRDRYLSRSEIAAVWPALEEENPLTRTAYKIALLTAQRIGSVYKLRWEDVTGDVWRIPADAFKGGRVHLVPLSAPATEVLEWVRPWAGDTWVLPSRQGAKKPHLSNLSGRALQRIRERAGIGHWVLHDFRRTFRTHAVRPSKSAHEDDPGGLGVTSQVADAVLGHKEASVGARHYQGDPTRYLLPEKREALSRWGSFVLDTLRN